MSDKDAIRAARDRRIRELARRGLSLEAIAKELGVSRTAVSRALGRTRRKR
jgi:predicted transcriptional regulator